MDEFTGDGGEAQWRHEVCLDMREANKAIVRERQPIPTVEETVRGMGGMKVFTKLDLNMAFHQVELHRQSGDITTFAAPNGIYRYKRLVFGLTKSKPWRQPLSRKNAVEVKGFLGSALSSAKFIPDFATITQSLWELMREKTEWKWTEEEHTAFDEVKLRLTTAPTMAYYRLDADTRIVTDASPVGLGAVLQQKQDDGQYRQIYYASRKLRDVETRYCQFEREALAVKWACDKFHLYLCGREFEIHTDHN